MCILNRNYWRLLIVSAHYLWPLAAIVVSWSRWQTNLAKNLYNYKLRTGCDWHQRNNADSTSKYVRRRNLSWLRSIITHVQSRNRHSKHKFKFQTKETVTRSDHHVSTTWREKMGHMPVATGIVVQVQGHSWLRVGVSRQAHQRC